MRVPRNPSEWAVVTGRAAIARDAAPAWEEPAARPRADSDSGADRPFVTIVVLAFNRREELRATLRTVHEELVYPTGRSEVIVVDNASTDGTASMIREEFPTVTLVGNGANVGIAGWNEGLERGRGDYFLLLDDDCYLTGDSLDRAVTAAQAHRADLVSFLVRSESDPDYVFNRAYDPGLLTFWGCAALVSRRAVETIGGFDPGIFVWTHELEYTMRLLDRRLRHLVVPEIDAFHMVAPDRVRGPVFYRQNARNLAYTAAKLLRPLDAIAALASLATAALLAGTIRPSGGFRSVWYVAEGAWRGSRSRAPVRRAVSSLYRANFAEFVSPFRFVRGPSVAAAHRRRDAFWAARPALYPRRTAWLEV